MKRFDRRFVIVSGLPGSGKTTVARVLAPALDLPIIDKDEILEELFEAKGAGDCTARRTLSRESDARLQSTVLASDGAVVCSFWHKAGVPTDSGTPTAWLAQLPGMVVNLHCECSSHVAASRFIRRNRHQGHGDRARTASEIVASIEALLPLPPLGVGELVVLDTSSAFDIDTVRKEIMAAFGRCLTRLAADGGR